jgi:hypothetical protein
VAQQGQADDAPRLAPTPAALPRPLASCGSPVLTTCTDADGDAVRLWMAGGEGDNPAVICAPRPRLYLARLLNLVRQREAAGCPIRVPDPEADGADEPA